MVNSVYLLPDVDECAQGDLCLGGVCANTPGSYSCTRCKAGYTVSQDRQRCEGKSILQLIHHKSLRLFTQHIWAVCQLTIKKKFPSTYYSVLQWCLNISAGLCFTQILTSASLCLPVPTGSVWTRKAPTPVRTALPGTEYHMTGSYAKVGLFNTTHLNRSLHKTTCSSNSGP